MVEVKRDEQTSRIYNQYLIKDNCMFICFDVPTHFQLDLIWLMEKDLESPKICYYKRIFWNKTLSNEWLLCLSAHSKLLVGFERESQNWGLRRHCHSLCGTYRIPRTFKKGYFYEISLNPSCLKPIKCLNRWIILLFYNFDLKLGILTKLLHKVLNFENFENFHKMCQSLACQSLTKDCILV